MPPEALPVALVIWFPHMGAGGMPWKQASPHIWTREVIEAALVDDAASAVMPDGAPEAGAVRAILKLWR